MRAVVLYGPGDVRVEDRPVPTPGPGELVARVSHCGICGTDLHMMVEGWGRPGSTGGHEWSGTVTAVGEDVDGFAVGDRIVGGPTPPCERCPACRDGRPSLCHTRDVTATDAPDGAFADFVCIDARCAVPVPPGLNDRHAALAEPLAVALHAVTRSGVVPGDRVLVSGAGPIGILTVAALGARGVDDVVVCEPKPSRRALAHALGATVVEPSDLEQFSIAEPHRMVDQPFAAAIECSGQAVAAVTALCQLTRGGTLVLVGTGIEPPAFDPNRILLNELTITGAYEYDAGGFAGALELLASGAIAADIISEPEVIGLDGMADALRGLVGGEIAGKVLITPSHRSAGLTT